MLRFNEPVAYDPVWKTLHWATVAVVIALLALGWTVTSDLVLSSSTRGALFAWHKSLGVSMLFLGLVRLYWRSAHHTPPMPTGLRPWEIVLGEAIHKLLYALLILQPLVGWLLYTVSPHKANFFGMFPLPDLPFPHVDDSETLRTILAETHGAFAAVLATLIVVHGAAAFKHHFVLRDDVLLRMAPALLTPFLRKLRGEREAP